MITVEGDDVLLPELEPKLIAKIRKYGNSVEIHVFLAQLRPGYYELVLRDYQVLEERYVGAFTIPLPAAKALGRILSAFRLPRRRGGVA